MEYSKPSKEDHGHSIYSVCLLRKMLNCTEVEFTSTTAYRTTQIVVLTVFLGVVVFNNLLAIFATSKANSTKNCIFCQLYNISYFSNIISAISLYGGTIIIPGPYRGDIRSCQVQPIDRYFFFYFGVYNNIIVLLGNTYLRRLSLTKPFGCTLSTDSLRKLVLRFVIPLLLTSTVISIISIMTQKHVLSMKSLYMETSLLLYATPLLVAVIAFNVHLTFYLNERKKVAEKMNIEQSWKNIENARKMVMVIVKLQTVYCALWVILIILLNTVGQRSETSSVVLVWMMRLVFGLSFVLEAKILIRRDKLVQKVIVKTLKTMFKCN